MFVEIIPVGYVAYATQRSTPHLNESVDLNARIDVINIHWVQL